MQLTCTAQRCGVLLSFLRSELRMSSSLVGRLKYQNQFCVNGVPQHTNYPVAVGDEITVTILEPKPDYPAEDGPLDILYEDEAMIAIDKPAGLLTHPSAARNTGTLANFLAGYYARTGQACAVHPVSRLDRDTFGVVLIAKNSYTNTLLNQAMRSPERQKCYHAAVFGGPEADAGVIDAPIARLSPMGMLRGVRDDGQPARTRYRVLERRGGYSLLELEPLTGRTHQLRVHCAWAGFPILGDPQYGPEEAHARSEQLGYPYQQLCAARLRFRHPLTGALLCLASRQTVCLPDRN